MRVNHDEMFVVKGQGAIAMLKLFDNKHVIIYVVKLLVFHPELNRFLYFLRYIKKSN